LPDQPLVERLPDNNLVELYPNRVAIYFEVDPMHTEMVHANVPINIITLICNCFFFASAIVAFGLLLVR